jgi:cell division septation protein DedD
MMKTSLVILPAALMFAAFANAQTAVVEGVQYPAWLERGGHAVPLTPGTNLQARDKLRTGGNARVLLKLSEGSAVKLGENAQFVVERAEDRGIFKAALSVIAGAFRFTTGAGEKSRARDVAIKVKNVTVGIRGTDLWGKSTPERAWVVLLEGKINVGSEGNPTVALDKPLDFYQKPRDGAPEVSKADPKVVEEWAKETEMSSDGAAASKAGRWRMVAAVKQKREDARALVRELRAAGYPGEIVPKGGQFLVQVAGLAGEAEARALMSNVRGIKGVVLPTVHEGAP